MKETRLKRLILYSSYCTTFSKMQNFRVRKQISHGQELGLGKGFDYKGAARGNFCYMSTNLYPDCGAGVTTMHFSELT